MVTNICVQALPAPASFYPNSGPYLPTWPSRKLTKVRVSLTNGGNDSPVIPEGKNPISAILDVPKTIWKQTLQPLSDFGFGQRSIWEGGVGLFVVSGAAILALSLVWLRGFHSRTRFKKYQTVIEFSQACGICVGTPVRIRGVTVGSVVRVDSSLKSIDAVVEIERMTEDIQPLLVEVRDSSLLKDVESLTKSLAETTEDLRKVNSSILTPESTELIRQSIFTLIFTLKNIESISADISGFTGDEATRQNLKSLIKSLSRLL